MAHRLSTVISGDQASPANLGNQVPRSLRLPRAVLLGLTLIYLGLGFVFVVILAERSRSAAADTLESRAVQIVAALDRAADRDRQAALTTASLPELRAVIAANGAGIARAAARIDPIVAAFRFDGYALLDATGAPVRGAPNDNVTLQTLAGLAEFRAALATGRSAFSDVVPAAIPTPDADGVVRDSVPVQFVGAAVRGAGDRYLGAIVFRRHAAHVIDPILRFARSGQTGDAIAFRRDGLAASATRFDEALAESGVIPAGRSASLRFWLLDPDSATDGTSAARVLTRAVAAAVRSETGSDVDGYVNARGATVVGAWAWSASLGLGVVVEVERAEALQQYLLLRNVYLALGLGIVLASLSAWRGVRSARRLRQQRKAAEQDLLDRERTLNAIIDSSPNAVCVLDSEGVIVRHNDAAEALFKRATHRVLGQPIAEFIRSPAELRDGDIAGYLRAVGREAEAVRGDGSTYPVELRWASFEVQGERLFTLILIDITARKETERALIAAKEEAEGAARAKSEFLAMMSHEIRTPMNGVLGMTSLLADTSLSAEQRQFVDATRRSAELLMSVINDILDFSKVEAGKMSIEPIPFDLHASVSEVAELLVPRAVEKQVELVIRINPTVPVRVIGDSGRIRQVLLNLAGNALKFTEQGHVLVSVDGTVNGDTAELRFEVSDTGIGIAEHVLPSLFSPFKQADASTTRRFGGTGLGLSISKRLVELMGGQVGVRSEEGAGSTFWFTLPLPIDHSPAPKPHAPVSLTGVRTVVVDDVPVNVQLLTEWLRSWGMRVDSAPDGDTALALMRRAASQGDPFRLAILDYLMPRMDGEMLGRVIREDAALANCQLILATSAAQRGDAERFHSAGFDAYLTKPFRPSVVAAACEAVLAREPGAHATEPIITRHSLVERGPRAPLPGVAASQAPAPASRASDDAPATRVLLVEDNPVNQMVAVRMLERLNCRIDVANDGAEAVRMAEQFRYEIIFMDVQMPVMDGFEATRHIRAADSGPLQPYIIAMTANAMQGDRERCLDAGMDDYVSKPVTPDSLRLALLRREDHRQRVSS